MSSYEPCGTWVVVAGAEMAVPADPVDLAAHDQRSLRVGLQPEDPVDHVHAGLFERPGPQDVVLLVEASLQLDDRSDLLAPLGGLDQETPRTGLSPEVR